MTTDNLTEHMTPDQKVARDELHKAFRRVLSTVEGKRVVFWMLEQCVMYQEAWTGENNETNYRLGRQASGRRVIEQMDEIDPRLYPALLTSMADIRETDRMAAEALAANKKGNDDED